MTSTEYYRTHPAARRAKQRYDKKLNARPEQIKKRVESNKARREAAKKGAKIKGKDYDHSVNAFVSTKRNRGRAGEGGRRRGVSHNK